MQSDSDRTLPTSHLKLHIRTHAYTHTSIHMYMFLSISISVSVYLSIGPICLCMCVYISFCYFIIILINFRCLYNRYLYIFQGLGDTHSYENPGILALAILFFRYHNYKADQYHKFHPDWSDDEVFEKARRWVIASLQVSRILLRLTS